MLQFKASALPLALGLIAVCLSSNAMAHQWDPLRRVREKAEKLRKKIECAVNDAACIDNAKKDGADVTTIPPPGAPPVPGQTGAPAAHSSPLTAVFTSTPLAPLSTPSIVESVVVSGDGARVAGVAMRGSRYVVVVDGQDGPPFDQIGPSSHIGGQIAQGAAAFGPGGKRVAYVGVREGQKVAVIDGEEGPPFRTIEVVPSPDRGNPGRRMVYFFFSEDGSRVAYMGTNPAAGNYPILSQVVLDGTPGPRYTRIKEMIFAGTRHAYIASRTDGKDVLVVDGKEQPLAFDGLQLLQGNQDGHIAVLGNRNDSYSVIMDGVEGKAHPHPDEAIDSGSFKLAPSGKRVAYAVRSTRATGPASQLYLDGKAVRTAVGFSNIVFSPDGTRLAGTLNDTMSSKVKVFVDEWTSLEYGGLTGPIVFSPDSKRFACVVANGPSFVIVDAKESPAHGAIEDLQFSSDSRHYAFVAGVRTPEGVHGGWTVVVDGKEGPKMLEVKRHSLTFSPDGSRVAYAGMTGFSNSLAVIDGEEHKTAVTSFKPRIPKMLLDWGRRVERWFVFSPDGKRVAYVRGASPQGGHMVSVVDGQPQAPGHLFALPTFSADGKRFAHIVWFNQKWFLSIDGKTVAIDGDVYEAPNSLAFQDDGSVRFLVVKDNMVHRVVATPKGGTN